MVEERRYLHAMGNGQELAIRKAAGERTLNLWQRRWELNEEKGQRTKRLIPDLRPWATCRHRRIDFYISQFLTGHGSFGAYTQRLGISENAFCVYCGEEDSPEHTVLYCHRSAPYRIATYGELGFQLTAETLVAHMIEDKRQGNTMVQRLAPLGISLRNINAFDIHCTIAIESTPAGLIGLTEDELYAEIDNIENDCAPIPSDVDSENDSDAEVQEEDIVGTNRSSPSNLIANTEQEEMVLSATDDESEDKNLKRGEYEWFTSNTGLVAVKWCDKRSVHLLSNYHNPALTTEVKRKQKDGTSMQVPCPLLLTD
ncbi:hypothetical protein NQ314_010780 [Rhamnusium bicolor]|uniref:Reverse transcriptase zinc-binding domain-containing protein n=1 Tax=Rhamnusium bicolor TaxID=1586634 RepID=A0AAV8XP74_9CUCU|nr:hypothetical protein NQ314_010780 [Rhamnusium bicolor]